MDISDKELFEGTLTETPVEQVETPAEAPAQTEDTGVQRDEMGRFVPKAQEPEADPAQAAAPPPPAQEQTEAAVPPWRLREEREARDALARQLRDEREAFQNQIRELQSRLPKPEPAEKPDLFVNPDEFVQQGVRQAIDPIRSEMTELREFYSRKDAIREHGQEKVKAAYDAIAEGMRTRDPEAMATYQSAMQSMDPYGTIVQWHDKRSVYSQIGSNPEAWFEKQLNERLAKDPAFQGKLLQQIQQSTSPANPQRQSVVQLPPSLNRVAAAASASDGDNDMSDAGLFRHATR